jgi:hypothetical protein
MLNIISINHPQPPMIPQPMIQQAAMQTATFANLQVGTPVMVKQVSDLQAIFSSPTSQWTRELGPRLQNNTAPRIQAAGLPGTVAQVDNGDGTVEVQCSNAKAWFTPEMLLLAAGAGTQAPVLVASGRTPLFADFRVGSVVIVKPVPELQQIYASPTSRWSTSLGPRMRNDTQPSSRMAGCVACVVTCDASDMTLQVTDGKSKTWFTAGALHTRLHIDFVLSYQLCVFVVVQTCSPLPLRL